MALAARQTISKIFAIFFPIMGFVAIGFEHCIANMYFIPAGIFLKDWANIPAIQSINAETLTWLNFLWKNLLPVTIGNIIGGGVFVGMSYWGAYLKKAPQSKSAGGLISKIPFNIPPARSHCRPEQNPGVKRYTVQPRLRGRRL